MLSVKIKIGTGAKDTVKEDLTRFDLSKKEDEWKLLKLF